MINGMKYKKVLEELLYDRLLVSVSSLTGKPKACDDSSCTQCIFQYSCSNDKDYFFKFLEWIIEDNGKDSKNKDKAYKMTNMECYMNDLVSLIAMDKRTMKLTTCHNTSCNDCYFDHSGSFAEEHKNIEIGKCRDLIKIWLQSQAFQYSEEEEEFLKTIATGVIEKIDGKCTYKSSNGKLNIPLGEQFKFTMIKEGEQMSIQDLRKYN